LSLNLELLTLDIKEALGPLEFECFGPQSSDQIKQAIDQVCRTYKLVHLITSWTSYIDITPQGIKVAISVTEARNRRIRQIFFNLAVG